MMNIYLMFSPRYRKWIPNTTRYYYQGCASWNWYFPFHYAPFASDFKHIVDMFKNFPIDTKPFNPMEQLMGVFPAGKLYSYILYLLHLICLLSECSFSVYKICLDFFIWSFPRSMNVTILLDHEFFTLNYMYCWQLPDL